MKVVKSSMSDGYYEFEFYCPGCKQIHGFRTTALPKPAGLGQVLAALFDKNKWTWNEDFNSPTIKPSIHIRAKRNDSGEKITLCHSFVKAGQIQFLMDCVHALKGQTVDLPNVEENV